MLGRRVRELRDRGGMTLASLAAATGISIGTLSQLERGLVSPTVRTVFTLSGALGVSPAWLIDPNEAGAQRDEEQYIVRANRRRRFLDSGGVRKDLASPRSSEQLRGYMMVVEPGCGSGAEAYSHPGQEMGLVLSGTLSLIIDGQEHVLNEGDTFAFSSERPHRFSNVGARPASIFWVNASVPARS
jgi:transcriptional regulator with XRE-family HTH domain